MHATKFITRVNLPNVTKLRDICQKEADDRLEKFCSEFRSRDEEIAVLLADMEAMKQSLRQTMLHRHVNMLPSDLVVHV